MTRRARLLPAALAACSALLLTLSAAGTARAELLGQGPALIGGWSGDQDASGQSQDLGILAVGWRWHFDGADFLDNFFAKARTEFSWAVEPLIGAEFGDAEAFECSVVPFARWQPLGWEGVVPFLEGGIGLAYTGLRNYGLGSRVEFSDNVGVGIEFEGAGLRWNIGYRFRHFSHAGIFDDQNQGLNAHFLAIAVEL